MDMLVRINYVGNCCKGVKSSKNIYFGIKKLKKSIDQVKYQKEEAKNEGKLSLRVRRMRAGRKQEVKNNLYCDIE